MVCIDSDVLIDFLNNEKYAIFLMKKFEESGESIKTTSINSFEILNGVAGVSHREKYEKVLSFLNNLTIIDFTFDISKKAAEIFNDLKSKGNLIEIADIMIASICIENQEPLITRNTKHFSRIKELELEKI